MDYTPIFRTNILQQEKHGMLVHTTVGQES
jgi:hypothetical protein